MLTHSQLLEKCTVFWFTGIWIGRNHKDLNCSKPNGHLFFTFLPFLISPEAKHCRSTPPLLHTAFLDPKHMEKEEQQSSGWKLHKNPGQKDKPRGPPPSKPNNHKKTQSWVPKTRQKTTSPRAKLQPSGFVLKRIGQRYWKPCGWSGKRQEESGMSSAARHPCLPPGDGQPGDKWPHLIQLCFKQPASKSSGPAGNFPKTMSKIMNSGEKFVW